MNETTPTTTSVLEESIAPVAPVAAVNTSATKTAKNKAPDLSKQFKEVNQVLKYANSQLAIKDRIAVLRANDTKALRYVLQGSYDAAVVSLLPDGEPPYTPNKKNLTLNDITNEIPKLFKYGPMTKVPSTKVEFFFIGLLSSLIKEEAMVLVRMKDKILQQMYKRLTKQIVSEFLSDTVKIK